MLLGQQYICIVSFPYSVLIIGNPKVWLVAIHDMVLHDPCAHQPALPGIVAWVLAGHSDPVEAVIELLIRLPEFCDECTCNMTQLKHTSRVKLFTMNTSIIIMIKNKKFIM